MLTEACKLYIQCDYIKAALKALATFTYNVTMAYLNYIEQSTQEELSTITSLKKLFQDLTGGKMDTLKKYHVEWTQVDMKKQKPTTLLDHQLLNLMCKEAAKGIEIQYASEYWAENNNPRATTAQAQA